MDCWQSTQTRTNNGEYLSLYEKILSYCNHIRTVFFHLFDYSVLINASKRSIPSFSSSSEYAYVMRR